MYLKVVKDILENYSNYLTMEELVELQCIVKDLKKNNNVTDQVVIVVNNILNKIWDKTLTNVKDFKNGDRFCFLVRNSIFSDVFLQKIPLFGEACFVLLNQDNIQDFEFGENFLVVKPKYVDNIRNKPLLPMYFENLEPLLDVKYDIGAVMCFDDRLEDISFSIESCKEYSEENNIPCLLIDKILYRKNKGLNKLSNIDMYNIIIMLYHNYTGVIEYSNKEKIIRNRKVRNEVLMFYENKINLDELKNNLFQIFQEIDLLDNKNKKIL